MTSTSSGSVDLGTLTAALESPKPGDRMLALVQLRHVADELAVPLILKVVHDEHIQVRSFAVFALGVKRTEASFPKLVELMTSDDDYGIRADAAGALGYLGDPRGFEPLVRAFYEDVEWLVRFSAAVSLGNLGDPRAYDVLIRALDTSESLMHQAAIAALGEIGELRCLDQILAFAQSNDWLVRQRLAQALGNLPAPKSRSALEFLAKDPHPSVAAAAQASLEGLTSRLDSATDR